MKKVGLFLLSMVVAFVLVEVFLQLVIGYPTHGVENKLVGISSPATESQYIFKPHSRFFTIEGGYSVFSRNNLGFTGLDVDTSQGNKYIAVLGNSYLEAYQMPPESTAVGVAQKLLQHFDTRFQILNLGLSKYDALDLLYRVTYYNEKYKFEKIILVFTESHSRLLNRHQDLQMSKELKIFEKGSKFFKFATFLRNQSVLFSLMGNPLAVINTGADDEQGEEPTSKPESAAATDEYDRKLLNVIEQYIQKFGDRFVVINIAEHEQESIPPLTSKFINESKIQYKYAKINVTKNKINSKGHLNKIGNYKLGKLLYEAIR